MSSTHRGAKRSKKDFYRTPKWCVDSLYKALTLPRPTLDPCAGDGALIAAFPGPAGRGYEIQPNLVKAGVKAGYNIEEADGLRQDFKGEHVLMNPPYGDAEKWVEKAVTEAKSAVVLLRLGFLASIKRYEFWRKNPPAAIAVLSRRPSFLDSGKVDSADYCWVYWRKGADKRLKNTLFVWLIPEE